MSAKILIVDDESSARLTLKNMLLPEGYTLQFANNGAEGLAQAQAWQPDVILSDVMMPVMDGLEFCQQIRADANLGHVPIILVTALDDRQAKLRGLGAGADDFISKPIDSLELRARLRTLTKLDRFRKLNDERLKLEQAHRELLQAHEALGASEERFRSFIEQSHDGFLLTDEQGFIIEWNPALTQITGLARKQALGMTMWNLLAQITAPEHSVTVDAERLKQVLGKMLQTGQSPWLGQPNDVKIRTMDREIKFIQQTLFPIPTTQGYRLGAVIHDVTERKQAEETLRQNEELYRTLVEALDVSLSRWLPDTTLVFANEKYRRVFGLEPRIAGQKWLDFMPEAAREETAAFYQDLARNPHPISYERSVAASDGSVRYYQWIDTPILDAKGRAAVFQSAGFDLTERKHTEQLVHAQRDLARIVGTVTSAEDAWPLCLETVLWVSGMDSGGIYLFDAAGSTLELVFQQGLGPDFVQAVARYPVNTPSAQIVLAGAPVYFADADLNQQAKYQAEGLHAAAMIPIQYQGEILGCFNIASHSLAQVPEFARHALETVVTEVGNIIAYLRTSSRLRESEEKYRSLVDSQDAVIATVDADGVYHYMNSIGAVPLAGSPEAVVGRNLRDFFPAPSAEWQLSGIRQVIATGQGLVSEYKTMLMGQPIWRRVSIQPVRDAAGQVVLAMVNSVDITQQKQAEETLKAEQLRFEQVAATVPGAITTFRLRPDGTLCIPYASPAFEDIYGLPLADVAENINALAEKIPPEQVGSLVEAVSESARTLQPWRCEYPYRHPLKGDIWLEGYSMPIREADGSTVWHGIATDITERKQAEAALRKSEALLAEAQRVGRTGHLEWTVPDRNLICSDELYAILEIPKDSGPISKQTIAVMMDPEDRERLHALDVETFANRADTDYEYRINLPDGRVRWLHQQGKMSYNETGKPVRMIGIIQDITERKQAEAELQRTEKRYRALIEHAPDGIVLVSAAGKFKYISPSTERLFGYLWDENLNLEPAELTHPDDQSRVIAALVNLMQDPLQRPTLEYRFLHKNGDWRWVQSTFSNLLAVPNVEAIVINFKDITERKQAEEAQRESEERFRTLYETMLQGIVYQDVEGRIIGANPAAERILGLTLDQMQGRSSIDPGWRAIREDGRDFPGESHPAMVALRTGEPVHNVVMGVFHPQTEQYVWISINAAPQFKPGQTKPYQVYTLFEDITTRRLNQNLAVARLRLIEFASTHTVKELLQATLDEASALVYSPIGFYHFVDDDQNTLTLQAWSTRTRKEFCTAAGEDSHYPVELAGVWADCLRQRRPIIHNDYATVENRKGLPAGHAEVVREAVVPIMRGDQVVAILGIGNKPTHYTPEDLEIINTFADMSWDIVERKRAEENLRESRVRVELALKGANAGMWDWYVQTGQTIFNERWAEIIGYSLAELEPVNIQTWIDACHPDDLKLSDALLQRHFAGETEFYECEARMKHRNGSWVWVIDRGQVVEWSADGKPIRMTGTHLDITESKQAEQELVELNRTLEDRVRQRTVEVQDLYDNAPIGYHSLDQNGAYVLINQTELDWLGCDRAEVIGRPLSDFIAPPGQSAFQANYHAFKQRGWVKDREYEFIRKDGSTFSVLLNGTAIYDDQGNFVMSRTTVFDNTERKKAETALRESEEQNRLLFEESPDAVVLFDEVGQVVEVNHAFQQLTGYTRGQLTSYTLDELGLLSAEQAARLAGAIMQAFRQNSHFQAVELRLQRANEETRDVGARIFGVQIRGRQHYLATMRDITTEKQAEKTLRLANVELARAARAKDEFLANMSHELRTPLNAILGFSEALLEQVRGPLNERQQASVRNIETSGRHLLALISDILDLSKVEAGRLELLVESVPVADICQACLLFVKETALKKQLQLAFHLNNQLAKVEADPKRLKQMLVNLLSNAVKFTPEGGQVSLEVTADPEAGVIRFAVQDNGIGITPEGMARLFQPFMQLDSSLSRQYEGTGLGLALVRRLAELHGGSVTVESEGVPGRGSRFTIALPYHPAQAADAEPAAAETGHTVVRRPLHSALVVEDSKSAAEQLVRYLQEANVHAIIHPQGAGALDRAIHLQPDVIFLDILMPDQSGWDVLTQLKADPRTQHIPVVIVSVVDEPAKGLAAGATVYLVKPITREIIQRALDAAAGSESVREALVIVPEVEPAGARILLAEDNEINIEAFEDYLQSQGYQVVIARNGREAVALAVESRPDLILMDIQMPELDGLEATRQLRARFEFATTPIIALTALAMPGDRERCLAAGASEYLTKPIKLRSLVEIIEKLLQQ